MNNTKYLKQSKLLEKITLGFDALFILLYIFVFFKLYSLIIVPDNPPVIPETHTYDTMFGLFTTSNVNFYMSLSAIFMVVAIPMLVVNTKGMFNRNDYQYDRWLSTNTFVQGVISLLTLNIFSAIIRFFNTFIILNYAEGHGFVGFLKNTGAKIKGLFEKKPEKKVQKQDVSKEELELRERIRKQTFLNVLKVFSTYLFLSIIALFIFIPFYWMVMTALKTYYESNEALDPKFFVALKDMQWVNIKYVLSVMDFGLYIKNTIYVGIMSTIGTIITTILAAFAFSRLEFKGRETIFSILLMTMMIPGELYIITNFITVSRTGFGWIGSESGNNQYFLAMIVPFMTSVFYIFFLRQTFKQIPDSMYKAARVDGCSDFKFLTRIMVPIAGPTIFTITILSVIGSWNAFIWPRLITAMGGEEGQQFWLISVALRDSDDFVTSGIEGRAMYNLQIAASAIVTVPLLIVFLALRKFIMSGVGRSGTKG